MLVGCFFTVGSTVSVGLYPNFFASSASCFAFFSISSKSISSSVLLILLAAKREVLGPLPLPDNIDFLAAVLLFFNLAEVVVVRTTGFFFVKSSVEAFGVAALEDNGDAVLELLTGLFQLEKKSSVDSLGESLNDITSVTSSNVTISGCLAAFCAAFCFNFSLYLLAQGDVYLAVASTPFLLLTNCDPPFLRKKSLACWFPPNLKFLN